MRNVDWCRSNNINFLNLTVREATGADVWEVVSNDSAHYGVIGGIVKSNSNETAFHAFRRWLDSDSLEPILKPEEMKFLMTLTKGMCSMDSRMHVEVKKSSSVFSEQIRHILIKVYNGDELLITYTVPVNLKLLPFDNLTIDRNYTLQELGLS